MDYFETFAQVVWYESIKILLVIAAKKYYEIAQFDVKTAFLYGDLQEEVYLQQPPGYIQKDQPHAVFKLHRSIYVLKQLTRCWNAKFAGFLTTFNFVNINSDKCVFVGMVQNFTVYWALYVDDGLVLCKSKSAIDSVLNELKNNFQITVDNANEFVGVEIKRDREKRLLIWQSVVNICCL